MAPKIVEVEENQDVFVVVDGQVVLVLKARPVSLSRSTQEEIYKRHEFVGYGVTVGKEWFNQKYIGQAAAGMSISVPDASVKSFVESGVSY